MILTHQSKSFPPVILSHTCSRWSIICKNEVYSLPKTCNSYICIAIKCGILEAESWSWSSCLAAVPGEFVLRALLYCVQCLLSSAAAFQQHPTASSIIRRFRGRFPKPKIGLLPWNFSLVDRCWLILHSLLCTFGNVLLGSILKTHHLFTTI